MKTVDNLKSFAGYKVLPVIIGSDAIEHMIYVKRNDSKNEAHLENSMFLANVPVDASLGHFKRLFRKCGVVEKVLFKDNKYEDDEVQWMPRPSGVNCHIVFTESDSVEKVLCMKVRKRIWTDKLDDCTEMMEENTCTQRLYGVSKWISLYKRQRPSIDILEARVNKYMTDFENAEKERKQELLDQRNLPDEDGFVMVSRARGRRNTNKDGNGAIVTTARPDEILKIKPKKKELQDFYRFQFRESKRKDLAELRIQFEEDKKKIAALKSDRKFKPY